MMIDRIKSKEQKNANKQMAVYKQHFISKWTSKWISTGQTMVEWKLQYKNNFPFCNKQEEKKTYYTLYKQQGQQNMG